VCKKNFGAGTKKLGVPRFSWLGAAVPQPSAHEDMGCPSTLEGLDTDRFCDGCSLSFGLRFIHGEGWE